MRFSARRLATVATLLAATALGAPSAFAADTNAGDNVYAARPGLDPEQLVEYIQKLQAKPKSIRIRPGFCAAIVEAAERVLAGDAKEELKTAALLAKLSAWHEESLRGSADADKNLMKAAEELKDDARQAVASDVRFYAIEQRAIEAGKLADNELAPLLDDLQKFFAATTPEARHIRLASATVRLINRLPDEAESDRRAKELGELLAKSEDRTLSRYGKRLKGERELSGTTGEMVGKTLDLAGTKLDGTPFDWESYRGKVVLVDFWATWCGPCVAEIPNVKENYDKYHEKGFDVVGISCDSSREDLEEFLKENKLEWANIFEEGQTKGEPSPLAQKYNITGIPSTFLVDREGKVIAQDVRGSALGVHLQKLFDTPAEGSPEKAPAEKAPDAPPAK